MKISVVSMPCIWADDFSVAVESSGAGDHTCLLRFGAACEDVQLHLTDAQAAATRDAITAYLEAVQYVPASAAIPEAEPQAETLTLQPVPCSPATPCGKEDCAYCTPF